MDTRTFTTIALGDENLFFKEALLKARWALGTTWPNPSVGAVIVKDGRLLATGHTHPVGGLHAERDALSKLKSDEAQGGTLYVTLEPCRHHGRTPPCTEAIIRAGIGNVIYGALDPNPLMAGKGINDLKKAGIRCEQIHNDALIKESQAIIAPFRQLILQKRPYVILKIATSSDNKVAAKLGERSSITGSEAQKLTHNLRRSADAILVGGNTAIVDNPLLTARLGTVTHKRQPVRVIVQGQKNLPTDLQMFQASPLGGPVWLFHDRSLPKDDPALSKAVSFSLTYEEGKASIKEVLTKLGEQGITSLLVEAGPGLFAAFLEQHLADEIVWLKNTAIIGDQGVFSGFLEHDLTVAGYQLKEKKQIGQDVISIYQ